MIVQPDFLDHWKTKALITMTKDPTAPLMVLRLWAYCQQKRCSSFFDLSDARLAAVCHFNPDANPRDIRGFLIEAGFIRQDSGYTIVHDWDVINASLLSSWKNGQLGGRPIGGHPTANPRGTRREPSPSNLIIRGDKKRDGGLPVGYLPTPPDQEGLKKVGDLMRGISEGLQSLKSQPEESTPTQTKPPAP